MVSPLSDPDEPMTTVTIPFGLSSPPSVIALSSFAESILPPTSASSQSPAPTLTPIRSFAWSNIPPTFDTCTSATFRWGYSGTSDLLEFILVPQMPPPTNSAIGSKRTISDGTTIAAHVDPTTLAWTWPKVNASAGEYVLQASGSWFNAASSSFAINDGADTSCLAAIVTSTTSTTPFPRPSNLPTTSVRSPANTGTIAGGAVAGAAALIMAILGYRTWARRRRQQLPHSHNPTEAAHRDAPSLYVASGTPSPAPPFSEKNAGGTNSLNHIATLDSLLSPNRRPPSFLLSDPCTPVPPYPSHTAALGQGMGSIMDVSTIGSRSSAAVSDATSTAGLMRTLSSCPPSYATRPSAPPSYTTNKTHSTMTQFSYASSS
ncbi:hypothetical protein GSI_11001 [Ganoderma sinense ZZ0214-1]|uniref:Uncharacterized protein n=1 Tax=Ganoderma sinense ZZ0214-1 TaxID=1077348 RepID=A0A2G8S285_9APHY|nr:hypothetical protein GSI_11001 [Ganoderma sinense ZZ0214-1]